MSTSVDAIVIGSGQAGPFLAARLAGAGMKTALIEREHLGTALQCIEGDAIAHALLDVVAAGASYRVVRRAASIHPTVSELIPTLLGKLTELGSPA